MLDLRMSGVDGAHAARVHLFLDLPSYSFRNSEFIQGFFWVCLSALELTAFLLTPGIYATVIATVSHFFSLLSITLYSPFPPLRPPSHINHPLPSQTDLDSAATTLSYSIHTPPIQPPRPPPPPPTPHPPPSPTPTTPPPSNQQPATSHPFTPLPLPLPHPHRTPPPPPLGHTIPRSTIRMRSDEKNGRSRSSRGFVRFREEWGGKRAVSEAVRGRNGAVSGQTGGWKHGGGVGARYISWSRSD